ncbi:MAG: sulfatase-like hydrolase/transferase [Verrucomicrobiales bacterium]|nr:sulfatase-like hydrolase/transferase [Verrucomicrobiales bacterium]
MNNLPSRAGALALGLAAFVVTGAAADRPNVLLIYADDLGSVDLNCYGATDLVTPNLDALAARGVRFTQFYSAAPVCSPSRAAVLTGRYPQRAGVPGNVSSAAGHAGMPTDQRTLAELLRAAGYTTAHVGKWHLGYTPETMPNGQGFDHSFGHMGGCIDNYSHFFYWNGPNRHDLYRNGIEVFAGGQYFPDLMVREIEGLLERKDERPLFIYWAFNVPHYPYQGDAKWLRYYQGRLPYPRDLYAAFTSTLDERIGRVLRKLDELGLREETIVIFQSDNGHSTEERAHRGGGSAGPYRGYKFSLFEGGIRLPAIISWPGHLPQGAVRDQLAVACDWLPTVLELCGAPAPAHRIDGASLLPVLRSPRAPGPHPTFHWRSGGGRANPQWAVRDGSWKLVVNGVDARPDEAVFLSDLGTDASETRNAAAEYPEVVQRLRRLHEEWLRTATEQ